MPTPKGKPKKETLREKDKREDAERAKRDNDLILMVVSTSN